MAPVSLSCSLSSLRYLQSRYLPRRYLIRTNLSISSSIMLPWYQFERYLAKHKIGQNLPKKHLTDIFLSGIIHTSNETQKRKAEDQGNGKLFLHITRHF